MLVTGDSRATEKNYNQQENINKQMPLKTEEQIRNVFGDWFCKIAGMQNLLKMKSAPPEFIYNLELDENGTNKIVALPKGVSNYIGISKDKRPFIAISVSTVKPSSGDILYNNVEIIFKRDAYGKQDDYVCFKENLSDDGKNHEGWLNSGFTLGSLENFLNGLRVSMEAKAKIEEREAEKQDIEIKEEKIEVEEKKVVKPTFTKEQKQEIIDLYGEWFCEKAGIENLLQMPEFSAAELNLTEGSKYHQETVLPCHLKGESAVRFKDSWERQGIAIKFAHLDEEQNILYEYVELLYTRYKDHIDNYVSALRNQCSDGNSRSSLFYVSYGANLDQLKDLLEGEIVAIKKLNKWETGYLKKI